MDIQTVIDNLDRTIAGKRELVVALKKGVVPSLSQLVGCNIEDLVRIRADLVKVRDGS